MPPCVGGVRVRRGRLEQVLGPHEAAHTSHCGSNTCVVVRHDGPGLLQEALGMTHPQNTRGAHRRTVHSSHHHLLRTTAAARTIAHPDDRGRCHVSWPLPVQPTVRFTHITLSVSPCSIMALRTKPCVAPFVIEMRLLSPVDSATVCCVDDPHDVERFQFPCPICVRDSAHLIRHFLVGQCPAEHGLLAVVLAQSFEHAPRRTRWTRHESR